MTGPDKPSLDLPADLLEAAQLTPEEARIALCLGLFHGGRLTREQASSLSGDPARFETALFPDAGQLDLNDFLDWASHDLKTPLNSIIGFSRVVLKGIDGPINETQEADLSTVYANGQRLLGLLSMLVDIARLNKGSLHLSPTATDLAGLLHEATARWRSQNTSRDLKTEIKLNADAVQVDAPRMKQLISGALTYAALQVVEDSTVSLTAVEEPGRAAIRIASQGQRDPAMPELERAMLPSINRSLARLHGGDLEESQNLDGGVTLDLWLPR